MQSLVYDTHSACMNETKVEGLLQEITQEMWGFSLVVMTQGLGS